MSGFLPLILSNDYLPPMSLEQNWVLAETSIEHYTKFSFINDHLFGRRWSQILKYYSLSQLEQTLSGEERFIESNNDFSTGKTPVSAFFGSSAKHLNKWESLPVSVNVTEANRNQDQVIAGDSLNSKWIQENKHDVNTHLNS